MFESAIYRSAASFPFGLTLVPMLLCVFRLQACLRAEGLDCFSLHPGMVSGCARWSLTAALSGAERAAAQSVEFVVYAGSDASGVSVPAGGAAASAAAWATWAFCPAGANLLYLPNIATSCP